MDRTTNLMDLPVKVLEAVFLLRCGDTLEFKDYFPKSFTDVGIFQNIPKFCFPEGRTKAQSLKITGPNNWLYHCFVFTNQHGARLYGHCLRFHSNDPEIDQVLALCVLSKQCYYNTMKHLLFHVLSDACKHDWRQILNFLCQISFCPQSADMALEFILEGNYDYLEQFESTSYVSYRRRDPPARSEISFFFANPTVLSAPSFDCDLSYLFSCLSVSNILTLYECVLSESKIVLTSSSVCLLAHVAHCLISLIWPFTWEHVLIPVLPAHMIDFIQAPTPFIMGIIWEEKTGQNLNLDEKETVLVDLDRGVVTYDPNSRDIGRIPSKIRAELKEQLLQLGSSKKQNIDYALPRRKQNPKFAYPNAATKISCHPKTIYTRRIQEAFFNMWMALFGGWDFTKIDDVNDHIETSTPPECQAFFKVFCSTTTFDQYYVKMREEQSLNTSTSETNKKPAFHAYVHSLMTHIDTVTPAQILKIFHRPSCSFECRVNDLFTLMPTESFLGYPPKESLALNCWETQKTDYFHNWTFDQIMKRVETLVEIHERGPTFELPPKDTGMSFFELCNIHPPVPSPRIEMANLLTIAIQHTKKMSPQLDYQVKYLKTLGMLWEFLPTHPIFQTDAWFSTFSAMQVEKHQECWMSLQDPHILKQRLNEYLDMLWAQEMDRVKKMVQEQEENEAKKNQEQRRVELFASNILHKRVQEEKRKAQLQAFDFSFVLSLQSPAGVGTAISRKALREWAIGNRVVDVSRADKLFGALAREKNDNQLSAKVFNNFLEGLKTRYTQYADFSQVLGQRLCKYHAARISPRVSPSSDQTSTNSSPKLSPRSRHSVDGSRPISPSRNIRVATGGLQSPTASRSGPLTVPSRNRDGTPRSSDNSPTSSQQKIIPPATPPPIQITASDSPQLEKTHPQVPPLELSANHLKNMLPKDTDGPPNQLVLLHQTGVFHDNRKGSLFLTNLALIFSPSSSSSRNLVYIGLETITTMELYEYLGVPCIRTITTIDKEPKLFCILSMREFWFKSIQEMISGTSVSKDLDDKSFLIDSSLSILFAQVALTVSKNPDITQLLYEDVVSKGKHVLNTISRTGVLNDKTAKQIKRDEDASGPCHIVTELLSTALTLLFSFTLPNNTKPVAAPDATKITQSRGKATPPTPIAQPQKPKVDFEKLRQSKDFEQFSNATAEMQLIKVANLPEVDRLAFLINTYNLMVLHGYFLAGFPLSLIDWRYLSRFTCYNIGGLPYTLDIIHRLLRGEGALGDCIGDHKFTAGDPRMALILPGQVDPRIHFLLCLHNMTSPPIRIVTPQTVAQHLEAAAIEYCESQVSVSQNCVVLSMLFYWYQQDFFNVKKKECSSPHESAELMLSTLEWLAPEQQKLIAKMVEGDMNEQPYQIRYRYDWTPNPRPTL